MAWKSGELELVKCDLCGSGKTRLLFTRPDGLDAVRCTACGLAYLNPRPKPDVVHHIIEKRCFSTDSFDWGYSYYVNELNQRSRLALARQYLDDILKHIQVANLSCLVVGCSTGESCTVLADAGATVTGIDISKAAVSTAAGLYAAVDFRHCGIEGILDDETFDVIFALDVLEHMGSPRTFVRHAVQHLQMDGRVVLSTPNYLCGRLATFEDRANPRCRGPEHLFFFTPEVLERYLVEQGLAVTEWSMHGGYVSLPQPPEEGKVKKATDLVLNFIDYLKHRDTEQPACQEVLPKMSRQGILMLAQKK